MPKSSSNKIQYKLRPYGIEVIDNITKYIQSSNNISEIQQIYDSTMHSMRQGLNLSRSQISKTPVQERLFTSQELPISSKNDQTQKIIQQAHLTQPNVYVRSYWTPSHPPKRFRQSPPSTYISHLQEFSYIDKKNVKW